jgi:hypothetical protein
MRPNGTVETGLPLGIEPSQIGGFRHKVRCRTHPVRPSFASRHGGLQELHELLMPGIITDHPGVDPRGMFREVVPPTAGPMGGDRVRISGRDG